MSHGGAPSDFDAAVYFAKHPRVDLIGMVLSRGEFRPEEAVDDWPHFVLDVLGSQDTRFGLGTSTALDPNPQDFPEAWRPGAGRFWDIPLPSGATEFEMEEGSQLIIDLVNSSPEKVTIIAMAAMTDVALALQNDPGIIDNIRHIVIMGGAVTIPGNLSDAPEPNPNIFAEWNMYIDATAADTIFKSSVPVSLVPLDAVQYLVTRDDITRISAISDPQVEYVEKIWRAQMRWWNTPFLIWDTITAVAVTDPEHFTWITDGIGVVTDPGDHLGQTLPLNDGTQHVRYAVDTDYIAVMETLLNTYAGDEAFMDSRPYDPITGLGGRWEGETPAFRIVFELEDPCYLGVPCGTFEIPDFSLGGGVILVAHSGSRYEFNPTILSNGLHSQAEYEYLQLQPDDTLLYHTEGGGSVNEGVLFRN